MILYSLLGAFLLLFITLLFAELLPIPGLHAQLPMVRHNIQSIKLGAKEYLALMIVPLSLLKSILERIKNE